jgi:diaminopimelate epimerase
MKLDFIKMNGAGNDFVIFDARKQEISLSAEQIRAISARDNPVTNGCDQLLILRKSDNADVFMQIYNADGGEVDACGNATRCIADMLYKELGRLPVSIETNAAVLQGVKQQDDYIMVDMGAPKFDWQDIPLAMPKEEAAKKVMDFVNMPELGAPTFVSMGNPHVVFFVGLENSLKIYEITKSIGAKLENNLSIFPNRVNVSVAYIDDYTIDAMTWERGAGETKACGTGACAILVSANKHNINKADAGIRFINSDKFVHVELEKDHILLGGTVEKEFEGTVEI